MPIGAILWLGYVESKHLDAMLANGMRITAACDLHDIAGILDSYNLDCAYFRDPVSFFEHLRMNDIDWLAVCTPNDLHVRHTIAGLRAGCNVICEKPIGIHSQEIIDLVDAEREFNRNVFPVVQLRYYQPILDLKRSYENSNHVWNGRLKYHAQRGPWYDQSWKGDARRSGGLIMNLGVHLFDLLGFVFGPCREVENAVVREHSASGDLLYDRANIGFQLACDADSTQRVLRFDQVATNLTPALNLHVMVYEEALAGRRFTPLEAASALQTIERVRERSM